MSSVQASSNRKRSPLRLRDRRARRRRLPGLSALTRMIFLANLTGLVILIIGALTLNQFSRELINAKVDNLDAQAQLITNLLGDQATGFATAPSLQIEEARQIIRQIDVPKHARIRLYDRSGSLIADSEEFDDKVLVSTLDPAIGVGGQEPKQEIWYARLQNWADRMVRKWSVFANYRAGKQRDLSVNIDRALNGQRIGGEQYEGEDLIVAVALPVRRVQKILGALVIETSDVDSILASQRKGLTPIILIAVLAAILSSLALTLFIALPIRRLARAAEQVRRSSDRRDAIPDLSERRDEIGDLSLVLRDMTADLYARVDEIADFAADVAHEIKNPLTSLRSASDTLRIAKTNEQREKLIDIIQNDVGRLDRLITDISKASRMDAALAKEEAVPLDMAKMISDMAGFYTQIKREAKISVVADAANHDADPCIIHGRESAIGQVLRNLIDNAITFSPKDGTVRLRAERVTDESSANVVLTVTDEGPGIPPENLETIFERFYTERPKGAVFGDHSGLGLAICRQIIAAHGGTIEAGNITDADNAIAGAQFNVKLPVQNRASESKPRS